MLTIIGALLCFALPSCGRTIIPDRRIPHRVADNGTLTVWARTKEGDMIKTRITVEPGWWIASPEVIGE
jgi:hypothetical protein